MIYKRFAANLRAQNWFAIGVELAIVIVGVFIGMQVSNWNAERAEKAQTVRLLTQLDSEMQVFIANLESIATYYRTTDRFAVQAMAGWRGDPAVSDNQFVIAAYQASQINGVGNNSSVWAQIFGAENLRNIDNKGLRQNLRQLMTFDYDLVNLAAAASPYREEVRKVIPDAQQKAIRVRCGDKEGPNGIILLPSRCDLVLPEAEAARTAAALRRQPELVNELNWQQAAIATQMQNIDTLKGYCVQLTKRID